jgi:hypothetical protein
VGELRHLAAPAAGVERKTESVVLAQLTKDMRVVMAGAAQITTPVVVVVVQVLLVELAQIQTQKQALVA